MPTSHDFDDALVFVAPAGGATAGTLVVAATTLIACLPLTTATSGNNYAGKITGRVNGVTKTTASAFVTGDALTITTAGSAAKSTAGGIINAYAAVAATAAATTCDVLIVPPINVA